jgi:hypothetical protein
VTLSRMSEAFAVQTTGLSSGYDAKYAEGVARSALAFTTTNPEENESTEELGLDLIVARSRVFSKARFPRTFGKVRLKIRPAHLSKRASHLLGADCPKRPGKNGESPKLQM